MVVPCEACGGRMSAEAIVCPHCGKRRAAGPLAGSKLSGDEIRALLLTDPTHREPDVGRGWLAMLVLPHPATSGGARTAELGLTVLSLPLVVAGTLSLALSRRRRTQQMEGELAPVLAMTVIGGLGLWSVLGLLGISGATMALLLGGSLAALWARGIVRARSTTSRSGELERR